MKATEKLVTIAKANPKLGRSGGLLVDRKTGKPVLIREAARLPGSLAAEWVSKNGWHWCPKKVWRAQRP